MNVGQLKNMFSFDLQKDSDFDGFADWVETGTGIFVSPWDTGSSSSTNDTDGDGILDGAEVTAGTDPNSSDTKAPTVVISVPAGSQEYIHVP